MLFALLLPVFVVRSYYCAAGAGVALIVVLLIVPATFHLKVSVAVAALLVMSCRAVSCVNVWPARTRLQGC